MNLFDDERVKLWRELVESAKHRMGLGDLLRAEELFLEAYERGKNIFGPNDSNLGLVLVRLAEVCEQQGKIRLAAEYKREVYRIVQLYQKN